MIKALIFDMDGVIIDSEPIHIELTHQVVRDSGKELDDGEIYNYIGVRNEEMWTAIIARHGLSESAEELIERQHRYICKHFFEEELEAIDGIADLIRSAKDKGLGIALATSSPRFLAEHILKNAGLLTYFDVLITADDIYHGKPDPEIYQKAAEALGYKPQECVAIEDAFNGILSAKSAGMKCIGYQNPNSGNQDTTKADFVVSSIREIKLESLEYQEAEVRPPCFLRENNNGR